MASNCRGVCATSGDLTMVGGFGTNSTGLLGSVFTGVSGPPEILLSPPKLLAWGDWEGRRAPVLEDGASSPR